MKHSMTTYKDDPKVEIRDEVQYDYDNQCWIRNGFYQDCAHPEGMECICYGRKHAGERAPNIH